MCWTRSKLPTESGYKWGGGNHFRMFWVTQPSFLPQLLFSMLQSFCSNKQKAIVNIALEIECVSATVTWKKKLVLFHPRTLSHCAFFWNLVCQMSGKFARAIIRFCVTNCSATLFMNFCQMSGRFHESVFAKAAPWKLEQGTVLGMLKMWLLLSDEWSFYRNWLVTYTPLTGI